MEVPNTERRPRGRPKQAPKEIERVQILMEARDLRMVDQEAKERHMSRGELIRRAIDAYLSAP